VGENPQNPGATIERRNPSPGTPIPIVAFEPNIYLYDNYPGGVGLSEPLFRMSDALLANTKRLIENCPCQSGCPSCVGPVGEIGEKGKEVALEILKRVTV
jgi:DEAD/DEAH box helicase domain-containing protein